MHARAQTRNGGWHWPLRLALLVPAVLIFAAAIPRLVSGIAQETAFPAEPFMQMNIPLTQSAYANAAQILSHAPPSDGDTRLWQAEALLRSGHAREAAGAAKAALAQAPSSARGWIVLAGALEGGDPQKAANALSLSLVLAPREYFLIPPRVQIGAALWRRLPKSAQERLLDDVRWLAADRHLRPAMHGLLMVKGGPQLVTRALMAEPAQLRALNRSLARERLGMH
jgi:hypothetical protein